MKCKQETKCKNVTIIGDTSKFHLGSELNYKGFRKLVGGKYEILQDIPYDSFGTAFTGFQRFFDKIRKSRWWENIENSDILIVHGEGLTEKWAAYAYHYLYFSKIAKELGIESWLVNFSMYEGEPFIDLLKQFSYMACRDTLTQKHLSNLGFNPELSFDCCVLESQIADYTDHDNTIAAIKGRQAIDDKILNKFERTIKYNCAWKWEEKDAVTLPTVQDYLQRIKNSKLTLSTSFHGNIFSYLSGIPFVSLDHSNPKYHALEMELLPPNTNNREWSDGERKKVYDFYKEGYDNLVKRAKLNVQEVIR